jgi:protein-tyrosine-phosphatase
MERAAVGSAGIIPREYLRHAEAEGVKFQHPHFGKSANIYALQYLAKKGIDVSSHRSKGLTKDMVTEADLILTIDRLIKKEVFDLYPETRGKVFTFKEYVFGASSQDLDIGDPMKLPDIDGGTGMWVWPEGYPDSYIAEIEQCLSHGIDKFVHYIKS